MWRDRPAVVSGKQTWTYAEHDERVRRAAAVVREELEIGAGDRVAVLLPNVHAMLELHYAVPGVGGVLVPLNTRLADKEYDYILEHCGAKVLVADRELGAARRCAAVVVASTSTRSCSTTPTRSTSSAPRTSATLISINYTSGTTGKPKGVMTNHRGAYLHALGVIAEARPDPAQQLPVDAADVPLQRLGLSVGGHRDGRQARLPPQGRGRSRSGTRSPRRASRTCAPRRPC